MTLRDDPQLTAYALDALDPMERAEIERRLAGDPDARAAVEEIRATATALSAGLASEPAAALPPAAKARLLAVAREPRQPAVGRPRLRLLPRVGSIAAVALLAGGVALLLGVPLLLVRGGGASISEHSIAVSKAPERPTPDSGAVGYASALVRQFPPTAGGSVPTPGSSDPPRIGISFSDAMEPSSYRVGAGRGAGGPAVSPGPGFPSGAGLSPSAGAYFAGPSGANPPGLRAPVGLPPAAPGSSGGAAALERSEPFGTEAYQQRVEAEYLAARVHPLSTFSVDVDTASYANVRRFLEGGALPPPDAVRVEEMVNYFKYADAPPTGEHPIGVSVEAAACPWALEHRLVRVVLKSREVKREARPAMNLVLLIDVSGSMDEPMKLPLVRASMRMLLDELNERDSVSIVTYAGESGVRLAPTSCERKQQIAAVVDSLTAGGSTNGASGISLAYEQAALGFKPGGANRVILCTDGDFNVGVTSHQDLLALIKEKAKSGVFLTVLGYGMGNLKDDTLELLADNGHGAYGYVDSTREAHRILVEQASGTLVPVAKDVKVQVEFNPAVVSAYRLVGYENRLLAAKDFKDDSKDAGVVGAGHQVTAFYEVVPVGRAVVPANSELEPLKYGTPPPPPPAEPLPPATRASRETLTVKVRYKQPDASTSVPIEVALTDAGASYDKSSSEFKFAAAVAAFGQILHQSPHRGTATLDGVLELAGEGLSYDPDGRRKEFVDLVAKAKGLVGR